VQTNIRSSIKKLQEVTMLIAKMPVDQARDQLKWLNRKVAPIVRRCLGSATANAKSFGLDPAKLIVSKVMIGKGTYLTRLYPHARHRAGIMQRPRVHLTVCVREANERDRVNRVTQYQYQPYSVKLAKKLELKVPVRTQPDRRHPVIATLLKRPPPARLDHPGAVEFARGGVVK